MKFSKKIIHSISGNDIHSITIVNDNNFKITPFYVSDELKSLKIFEVLLLTARG